MARNYTKYFKNCNLKTLENDISMYAHKHGVEPVAIQVLQKALDSLCEAIVIFRTS